MTILLSIGFLIHPEFVSLQLHSPSWISDTPCRTAILETTGKILVAAKNGEWDLLISLGKECKHLTDLLKEKKPEPNLSDELLQEKIEIIHQILEDDDQIRAITEPWMIRLQEILCANGYNRNL